MQSWIDIVVASTKYSEAPERYFWWSALATLSGVMRKNIYLDRHFYKLYTNVYVILVSRKSGLRKGIPVSLASKLLQEVGNTRVVEGQNSIEGIIYELAQQKTLENGTVLSDAQAILVSGEFDTFLVDNPKALTILTALQNTHEHDHAGWTKSLKGGPPEKLKNPCISLLAASNEVLFEDIVKAKDVEGGFLARSFIVYESKRRRINSLIERPEGIVSLKDLASYLHDIKDIKGEFQWTVGSKRVYEAWYTKLCGIDYDDRTGTIERLGDQVLKVAMLISMASRADLKLEKDDLEEAIDRCEECVAGVRHITMGSGGSEVAIPTAKVLKLLLDMPEHQISRTKLLKKLWPDIDSLILDRVIETLMQGKVIDSLREPGVGILYTLQPSAIAQYKQFKMGK
jgi:hypothetical protein